MFEHFLNLFFFIILGGEKGTGLSGEGEVYMGKRGRGDFFPTYLH